MSIAVDVKQIVKRKPTVAFSDTFASRSRDVVSRGKRLREKTPPPDVQLKDGVSAALAELSSLADGTDEASYQRAVARLDQLLQVEVSGMQGAFDRGSRQLAERHRSAIALADKVLAKHAQSPARPNDPGDDSTD
jgi:hypothetical protein